MEFGGPGLATLSPDERATLANMARTLEGHIDCGSRLDAEQEYEGADLSIHKISANPEADIFRSFRCYDDFEGMGLHGAFLVDTQGKVRWADVGYEPFKNTRFLLEESKRLLGVMESHLAGRQWFLDGEYSIADIAVFLGFRLAREQLGAAREIEDLNAELLLLLDHLVQSHLTLPEWGSQRLPMIPDTCVP